MYPWLYLIHVSFVILSGTFFVVRGIWMLTDSPLLMLRPVKIVPHIIDTVLLLSAVALAMVIGQYPFVQSWLTVKVVALVVYIGLGVIALRPGRSKQVRSGAFVAAILVFAFIVSVALTRHPLGVFHSL